MAWIDDRIWCHPKFTDLSAPAFRVYVNGVAYSTGMHTRGHLTPEQQKLLGATLNLRKELVKAGLWDPNGRGGIRVHDWDDYNAKRDARREADRERKRAARAKDREESTGTSPGQSAGRSAGTSTTSSAVGPRAPARESDGSEEKDKPKAVPPTKDNAREPDEPNGLGEAEDDDPEPTVSSLIDRTAQSFRSP